MKNWKEEVLSRLAPVIFLLLVWVTIALFKEITWPSNTLILQTVGKLTSAWIIISILTSVVRNRFLFRIIAGTLWVIAALSILGLLSSIISWLDAQSVTMMGETRISLLTALQALFLAVLLVWLVGLASKLVERALSSSSANISPSMQVLFAKLFRFALTIFAVITAMTMVGIDLTAFAVLSGAIGVGIGFGLQKTVGNFISGITLLLDKSIKPGDVISLGDTFGWVSRITTRYTSVVTRDGREHLIPNESLVSNEVVNWSYSNRNVRLDVEFGVSYAADPHKVKELIESASKLNPRILNTPKPICHFKEMGESSLNFVFRFWIADPQGGLQNVKSDVLFMVWDVLKENNIEIPFPQRDIRFPDSVRVKLEKE